MIEIKNTAKGIIVKALSGFYYVDIGIEVLECKARGIFKKNKVSPVIGDRVEVQLSGLTPVIIEVFSRKNIFVRPPVANIEQFIIVSALKDPEPNFSVIDKFLVNAEIRNVPILICFNKTDLADDITIKHIKRDRKSNV